MVLANHRQLDEKVGASREKSFGAPEFQITPLGSPNLALCPNDFSLQLLEDRRIREELSCREKKVKLLMNQT
jgi:hypothetical protein